MNAIQILSLVTSRMLRMNWSGKVNWCSGHLVQLPCMLGLIAFKTKKNKFAWPSLVYGVGLQTRIHWFKSSCELQIYPEISSSVLGTVRYVHWRVYGRWEPFSRGHILQEVKQKTKNINRISKVEVELRILIEDRSSEEAGESLAHVHLDRRRSDFVFPPMVTIEMGIPVSTPPRASIDRPANWLLKKWNGSPNVWSLYRPVIRGRPPGVWSGSCSTPGACQGNGWGIHFL